MNKLLLLLLLSISIAQAKIPVEEHVLYYKDCPSYAINSILITKLMFGTAFAEFSSKPVVNVHQQKDDGIEFLSLCNEDNVLIVGVDTIEHNCYVKYVTTDDRFDFYQFKGCIDTYFGITSEDIQEICSCDFCHLDTIIEGAK